MNLRKMWVILWLLLPGGGGAQIQWVEPGYLLGFLPRVTFQLRGSLAWLFHLEMGMTAEQCVDGCCVRSSCSPGEDREAAWVLKL